MFDKDALLTIIARVADEGADNTITVLVGGALISGKLVTAREYMDHSVVTKAFAQKVDEIELQDPPPQEILDGRPNFLHLKDAQYILGSGAMFPSTGGVYCRVSIHSVNAFNFGRFTQQTQ